jgi:hypothetical protein
MKNKTALLALIALLSVLPLPSPAQTEPELRALDQRCEEARTRALKPIRERLARECIPTRPRSPDPKQECETEVSTYGNSRTGARGNVVPGLFYDLPECQQAQAGWQRWDQSRPWK